MKTLCFKFHQNRAINEESYFWGGKILSGVPRGAERPDLKKIEKSLYRTVVSIHSQNVSILSELESVQKSVTFGGVLGPLIWGGRSNLKKKNFYRMMVRTYSHNFSTLAQLQKCVKQVPSNDHITNYLEP